jgi:hypothetical protein
MIPSPHRHQTSHRPRRGHRVWVAPEATARGWRWSLPPQAQHPVS